MSNISKNNYWIKLYHEILHDPKMGRLPDNVWRRCIELFLMAGETQEDGQLPSWEDICWHFRHIPEEQLLKEFKHLESVEILYQDNDQWHVTKFAARQAKITDAEKQRAYRERKRTETASELPEIDKNTAPVTEPLPESYPSVTSGNAEVEVRSKNTEVDIITTTTAQGELATFYQQQTKNVPKGITDSNRWEDDCITILDYAGGDKDKAQLLMSEAIITLDEKGYTHKQPGSLIETIGRNLQNTTKKRRAKNGHTRGKQNANGKTGGGDEIQNQPAYTPGGFGGGAVRG